MWSNSVYLFTQGVLLGWGPCLLFCGMYVLPAAVFSVEDKRNTLKNFVSFMLGRFLMYVLLGILSGFIGVWVLQQKVSETFRLVFLLVMLGMGIYILLKKGKQSCQAAKAVERNFFVLGILVGLAPCIPMLGILLQILLMSKGIVDSIVLSVAFGLGTLLNPLWLIIWGASEIKERLLNYKIISILQKGIGLFLIVFVLVNLYRTF